MTLRARRTVYLTFIGIFVIAAPLLLLYAAGYRYQRLSGGLKQTSTLVASTIPSAATIILNGQVMNGTTPKTIAALPPGTYDVRLQKPGYRTWEKHLPMLPGQAVFVSNVHLWTTNLPIALVPGPYDQLSLSPDDQTIALAGLAGNRPTFSFFNTSMGTAGSLAAVTTTPTRLAWSANGTRVLVTGPKTGVVLTQASDGSGRTVAIPLPREAGNLRWDANDPNVYFGTNGKSIYRFDLVANTSSVLPGALRSTTPETITDYWLRDQTLELLTYQPQTATAVLRSVPLDGSPTSDLLLPTPHAYRYVTGGARSIVLTDDDRTMTVWPVTSRGIARAPMLTAPQVTDAMLLPATGEILFTTRFEVWTYQPATDERTLLTRIGTEIRGIAWYPDGSHVLYATGDALHIVERDGRDVRNDWTLANVGNISNLAVTSAGDRLYFTGTVAKNPGLWRLDL